MGIKELLKRLKSRNWNKQKSTQGPFNEIADNVVHDDSEELLGNLIRQIMGLMRCKKAQEQAQEQVRQVRIEARELRETVCNAIYNILKDELGTVPNYRIDYSSIPISIVIDKNGGVYLKLSSWDLEPNPIEELQALIKYAPKLCKKLEKEIGHCEAESRHCEAELARDKKILQTLLDILTPLTVEGKLIH